MVNKVSFFTFPLYFQLLSVLKDTASCNFFLPSVFPLFLLCLKLVYKIFPRHANDIYLTAWLLFQYLYFISSIILPFKWTKLNLTDWKNDLSGSGRNHTNIHSSHVGNLYFYFSEIRFVVKIIIMFHCIFFICVSSGHPHLSNTLLLLPFNNLSFVCCEQITFLNPKAIAPKFPEFIFF